MIEDHLQNEVKCRQCGKEQLVEYAIVNNACCMGCKAEMCMLCGCTDEVPCVHPDFPNGELNCSWQMPGLCDHCYAKTAEKEYQEAVEAYENFIKPRLGPGGVVAVLNS